MTVDKQDLENLSPDERRELLRKVLAERAQADKIDFEAEAEIDLTIDAGRVDTSVTTNPSRILLTGTTGFVGAYALRLLLDSTDAHVVCLARAGDDEKAWQRIHDNLGSYGVWQEGDEARITAVAGDLSQERMGLDVERWQQLAEEVEVVYHIAALVNLAFKYALLKPPNVDGTRAILEFAAAGRVKPLHYLSSYALFDSVQNVDRTFAEHDEPVHPDGLSNGYCESKWVAERMVQHAREAGLPVAIYRVGWVVGHSQTGAWNRSDVIPRLIRSCIEVGKVCELGTMTMTPVDFLTRSLVALSFDEASLGGIFHLSNGERYRSEQLFEWVTSFGYDVERVSYPAWEDAMKASEQEVSLAPMLAFLEDSSGGERMKLSDWFSREPRIDSRATLERLGRDGIECPPVNRERMGIYLGHFIDSGYLEPPAQGDWRSAVAEAT